MIDPEQDAEQVRAAADARAAALAAGDGERLTALLHPAFAWTTHRGERLDRASYVEANTSGSTVWRSQSLSEVDVVVVGDTAVLHAEVTDVVGAEEEFRMPMTQVWVRSDDGWRCLAGHAGPRRTD